MINLNKNNFFTDVSNYLAYEIGQPTHCYDYHKIGNSLEFKSAIVEKEFLKLLNNKIKLDLKGPEKRRISRNKPPLLTAS
mgnify:CR=1 FL=1